MSSKPEECEFLRQRRKLGNTGLEVSPLGFGALPLGNVFGKIDEKSAIEAVQEAVRLGINFFDVSPYYGDTLAETVLGKALATLPRSSYVLSTKVGRYGLSTFDFSASRVTASIQESMDRLQVSYLDIVQCHDVEFGDLDQVTDETIPTLQHLKAAGRIGAVGVTGYPLELFPYVLSRCTAGVDVALSYCHLNVQNDRLRGLLPWLTRPRSDGGAGVGVINASPLCMGLFTPSGAPEWHPADEKIKGAAREAARVCEMRGTSLPQVAIKYALQSDDTKSVASTLVGIDSVETLYKNVRTLNAPADEAVLREVREVFAPVMNRRWNSGKFAA